MRVLFINNNGTGFADYVHISEGTNVKLLLEEISFILFIIVVMIFFS